MITLEQYGLATDVLTRVVQLRRSVHSVLAPYHEQSVKEQNEHGVIVNQVRTWGKVTQEQLAPLSELLGEGEVLAAIQAMGVDASEVIATVVELSEHAGAIRMALGDPEVDDEGNFVRYTTEGKRAKFNDVGVLEEVAAAKTAPDRQDLRTCLSSVLDSFTPLRQL